MSVANGNLVIQVVSISNSLDLFPHKNILNKDNCNSHNLGLYMHCTLAIKKNNKSPNKE